MASHYCRHAKSSNGHVTVANSQHYGMKMSHHELGVYCYDFARVTVKSVTKLLVFLPPPQGNPPVKSLNGSLVNFGALKSRGEDDWFVSSQQNFVDSSNIGIARSRKSPATYCWLLPPKNWSRCHTLLLDFACVSVLPNKPPCRLEKRERVVRAPVIGQEYRDRWRFGGRF